MSATTINKVITRKYRTFSVFLPIFKRPIDYLSCKGVIDNTGSYTNGGLLNAAKILAKEISDKLSGRKQERVAYFVPYSADMIIITWAIWMSGQIAVPLPADYGKQAHEYFLTDSDSNLLLGTENHQKLGEAVKESTKISLLIVDSKLKESAKVRLIPDPQNPENSTIVDDSDFKSLKLPDLGQKDMFYKKSTALIAYTSGNNPKGSVFSHASLHAQTASIVDAWRINARDCFLMAEPIGKRLNMMMCLIPLTVGGRIIIMENFRPENIWVQLLGLRKAKDERPNIIVTRSSIIPALIETYNKDLTKNESMTDHIRGKCMDQIRFFSVGDGPLTESDVKKWKNITGHQLLPNYSMTETGMIMAMPIHEEKINCTSVGVPMPGVHVRVIKESGDGILAEGNRTGTRVLTGDTVVGLLEVKSENLFNGYWRKPSKTNNALISGKWFKTADLTDYRNGSYSILGFANNIFSKKNGHRCSIPLVEAKIMENNNVKEVAVLPNIVKKDAKLTAFVVSRGSTNVIDIQTWINQEVSDHSIQVELIEEIPKNWSGTINREKLMEKYSQKIKDQEIKEKLEVNNIGLKVEEVPVKSAAASSFKTN